MSMDTRRDVLRASAAIGAGLVVSGFGFGALASAEQTPPLPSAAPAQPPKGKSAENLSATEDLMREHGVLRRILLIYTAVARGLRTAPASVQPNALYRAADLFRTFGEDYHERRLEEAHIFPAIEKAGGPAAAVTRVLAMQHQRGRDVTNYILSIAGTGRLGAGIAVAMADVLESMVLMYQHHAAREDTVVFPAWKHALSPAAVDELGEEFERIEHQLFGTDGFNDAVRKVADIEAALGIADIAQFTAPVPPKL
jgi:hemerythrin-like domain-containing protein